MNTEKLLEGLREAQNCVREFMQKAGQECPTKPTLIDAKTFELRDKLHMEECVNEFDDAWIDQDLVGIADSIGDSLVVILGTANACGLDAAEIFRRVHESNMTKFIDGHKDASGKWIKGPSYRPVELGDLCDGNEFKAATPDPITECDNCGEELQLSKTHACEKCGDTLCDQCICEKCD